LYQETINHLHPHRPFDFSDRSCLGISNQRDRRFAADW